MDTRERKRRETLLHTTQHRLFNGGWWWLRPIIILLIVWVWRFKDSRIGLEHGQRDCWLYDSMVDRFLSLAALVPAANRNPLVHTELVFLTEFLV